MDWYVVGVQARGFAGAEPPRVRLSLVSVGVRGHEGGLSRAREDVDAVDPVREPVGDLRWKLTRHLAWNDEIANDRDENDTSEKRELRIRVAGVGHARVDARKGGEEAAQQWQDIGESDRGYQVRLVLQERPGQAAERERAARHERIQRRQLELAMMRQVKPEKLLAWEERRKNKSSRVIQRAWRSQRQRRLQRTEARAVRKKLADKGLRLSTDVLEESYESPHGEEDEENDGGLIKQPGETEMGIEKEDAEDASNLDGRTNDSDLKMLHKLYDELTREAHDRMLDNGRFSTHEKFQALMEGHREIQIRWAHFSSRDTVMRSHERERARILNRTNKLCARLEQLKLPLSSYDGKIADDQNLAENEGNGNENQTPNEGDDSTSAINIRRQRKTSKHTPWPLSRDQSVYTEARNAHLAALDNAQVGKEWWRVQVGHEERDIRKLQAQRPPWQSMDNHDSLGLGNAFRENDPLDYENSKWWIAYASRNPSHVDAVLARAANQAKHGDVVEDGVRRDTDRLVREVETRLQAQEDPFMRTILSCPPHRLSSVYKLLKSNPVESGYPAQTTSTLSRDNGEAHSPHTPHLTGRSHSPRTGLGGSPGTSSGRGQGTLGSRSPRRLDVQTSSLTPRSHRHGSAIGPLSPSQVSSVVSPSRVVQRGKRKKRSKRKEAAMQMHIDALEEQVAVLRAQMAQSQLEKLRSLGATGDPGMSASQIETKREALAAAAAAAVDGTEKD